MTRPDPVSDADLERLSRLLDGELPPTEAADLRARLRAEPALAEAWAALGGLSADLGRLPTERPVPAGLDAAVLGARTARTATRPRWWLPLALAAAALVALRPWSSAPTLELVEGEQLVEGDVDLAVAGARVEIDGRARIRVEPIGEGAREEGQHPSPETPMKPAALARGAALGALVTVAVYEGSAVVRTAEGATTVEAGERRRVRTGVAADPRPRDARPAPPPAVAPRTLDEATARIAALEREVATLRFERDLQRGALQSLGGEPVAWPDDLPTAYREPAFTDAIRGAVAGHDGLELLGVDCAEYPCIAMIHVHADDGRWQEGVQAALTERLSAEGLDAPNFGLSVSRLRDGEDGEAVTLAGVVLGHPDHGGEDVQTRNELRIKEWTAQVTETLRASGEP